MQYWLFVSFKIKIPVFTCIEFYEWLSDFYLTLRFIQAIGSDLLSEYIL